MVALYLFSERTLIGQALQATAINRVGAQLCGVPVQVAGQLSFAIGAAFSALSGLLLAPLVTANYDMGFPIGLKGFVAAALGGIIEYPTALIGVLLVGLTESFSGTDRWRRDPPPKGALSSPRYVSDRHCRECWHRRGRVDNGRSVWAGSDTAAIAWTPSAYRRSFAIVVWAIVALLGGGFSRLLHTRTGRAIAALKSDAEMAEVFGVNATRLRLQVFVIAATLAGLSGALYAFYFKFLSPAPFGLTSSVKLLIACIFWRYRASVRSRARCDGDHRARYAPAKYCVQNAGVVRARRNDRLRDRFDRRASPLARWNLVGAPAYLARFLGDAASEQYRAYAIQTRLAGRGSSVRYGSGQDIWGVRALENVSISVGADQIVGLIGPNGAGKSTTFNIATGLLAATEGSVTLMGEPPPRRVSDLVHRGVSRTFQHVRIVPERTVLENVAFGAYAQGDTGVLSGMFGLDRKEEAATLAKAWRALEIVELGNLAQESASRLAMGQLRLLEVARALVSRPRLLLLDEPAAGLRTGEKLRLFTLLHRLKRSGMSVLLVEHDMDLVMNCVERVIVLDRGRGLMSGNPDEVRQDERVIAAYLGT